MKSKPKLCIVWNIAYNSAAFFLVMYIKWQEITKDSMLLGRNWHHQLLGVVKPAKFEQSFREFMPFQEKGHFITQFYSLDQHVS